MKPYYSNEASQLHSSSVINSMVEEKYYDNEPITEEDLRMIGEANARFEKGIFVTSEQVRNEATDLLTRLRTMYESSMR